MPEEGQTSSTRTMIRIGLFILLGLAVGASVIDRRARKDSQTAFDAVSQLESDLDYPPTSTEVQSAVGRPPNVTREEYGGTIEEYRYASGLPGRSFRVIVAYAKKEDDLRYVTHFLNQIDDEEHLAQMLDGRSAVHMEGEDDEALAGMEAMNAMPDDPGDPNNPVPSPDEDEPGGGGGRGGFMERLMSNDANEDGQLSADELPEERRAQLLERADTNQDNVLDADELQAMVERFRQREGGGRPGRGNRPQRPEAEGEAKADEPAEAAGEAAGEAEKSGEPDPPAPAEEASQDENADKEPAADPAG